MVQSRKLALATPISQFLLYLVRTIARLKILPRFIGTNFSRHICETIERAGLYWLLCLKGRRARRHRDAGGVGPPGVVVGGDGRVAVAGHEADSGGGLALPQPGEAAALVQVHRDDLVPARHQEAAKDGSPTEQCCHLQGLRGPR